MVAALCGLLTASCSGYQPIPTGSTFEREANRISDNLNKPVQASPVQLGPQPNGTPVVTPSAQQPVIIGQGGNEDLLRGLTDAPVNVDLRFEDAEIAEVANTILGDVLKKPYVIDTTLKGRVSLRIDHNLGQRALMDSLRQSVQRVGGDIRRVGANYEIVNSSAGKLDDQKIAQLRAANTSVTIVPLKFARASTVNDLLRAINPTSQQVTVDDAHNLLIISGPPPQRAQMAATAELLDVDGVANNTVAVYPLAQSNATALAEELKKVYQSSGGNQSSPVDFIPLPRNNALLVIARQQSSLTRVSQLIQGLDRQRSTTERRMYVVALQHARAPILANVLRESLGLASTTTAGSPATVNPASGQPSTMSVLPSASAAPGQPVASPTTSTSAPAGGSPNDPSGAAPWDLENVPLRIVSNADTNSLLIFATPGEYAVVQEAIRRLDSAPLQVLIEATILDVTLNDQLQFGVQAFLQNTTAAGNLIQAGVTASNFSTLGATSSGFNFIFNSGGQVQAAINALRSVTNVTVLSSPQVVTLDNQKANLEVGSQVPISTQSVTQTTTTNPAIVNSISYVQTGVILSVTPRVNTSGGVDLEIRQEVTDAPTVDPNNPSLNPVLTRRVIETRVSVQSAQTVALGGLITESTGDQRNRVPILGDIPVIGWLFGQTSVRRTKEELLVFLTPTVFGSPEEARNFSLELRQRLDSLWKKQGSNSRNP